MEGNLVLTVHGGCRGGTTKVIHDEKFNVLEKFILRGQKGYAWYTRRKMWSFQVFFYL